MNHRDIRDLWYQVARIREREGDTARALQARRNARIIAHGVTSVAGQPWHWSATRKKWVRGHY